MVSKIIEMLSGLKTKSLYSFLFFPLCAITLTTFHPVTNLLDNPFDWTHFFTALFSVMVVELIWRLYTHYLCVLVRFEGREGFSLSGIFGLGIIVWCIAGAIYCFNTMGMKTFAMSVLTPNGIKLLTLFMFGLFTLRIVFAEYVRMDDDEMRKREIDKKRCEEQLKKRGTDWKGINGIK